MRKLILTLLLCCSLSGLAADYEAGKAAYNRGDYAEAARRYRIAAEQGDVEAQNQLGYMYRLGQGVPKDDVEAASWTRKAAEQGNADAQARLGYMYGIGRGVPMDYVTAYTWCNLAAAKAHAKAAEYRDDLAQRMTPEQVGEAQKISRELFERIQRAKGD